jgi:hypothetical protein
MMVLVIFSAMPSSFGLAFGNGRTLVTINGPSGDAGAPGTGYDLAMLLFSPGSPHASVQSGSNNSQLDVKQGPDHAIYYSNQTAIFRLS